MKSNIQMFDYVQALRKSQRQAYVAAVGHDPLTVEEEATVDRNTQAALLEEWQAEQPLMPVATLLKVIRKVIPNFPDVPPEQIEARTQIQQRARQAYAAGRMELSKFVPDKEEFQRQRSEQRLPMMMTEEERNAYVLHVRQTEDAYYRNSGMTPEQIDASIKEHKKEKNRVILRTLKRMIDRDEQTFLRGMDDEELIRRYPEMAVTCALTQESVAMITEAMRYDFGEEFSKDDLRALRTRAANMMDNATNYDKRIAMMADTYYPTLRLEELYQAPVSKLEQLSNELRDDNLEEEYGVDVDDETLMNSFESVRAMPFDMGFDMRVTIPNRIARSLGLADETEMKSKYFVYDGNGNRLSIEQLMFELEKDKPLWMVRRDGSGEPVPVMADPSKRAPGALVGREAIAAATTLEEPAPMGLGARFVNGLSRFFRRKPTIAGREHAMKMEAYKRSLAQREQARTTAEIPQGVAKAHTELARAEANMPREVHEAGLEETMSVLPLMELTPGSIETNKVMAALLLDCTVLAGPSQNSNITMKETLLASRAGFNRDSAIDYLSRHPAFQELVAEKLARDPGLLKSMREGDKEAVRRSITEWGGFEFSPRFKEEGGKTEPSEEFRAAAAAKAAEDDRKKTVQPGHVLTEYSADLSIRNKGSAINWDDVLGVYGANRPFHPEWTPLHDRHIYTLAEWNHVKESNVDINRFQPDGRPMEEKDFASMAMILTIRPDSIKNVGSRPGTTPYEDITMANNSYKPRDGVFQVYDAVMLPSRMELINCLDHMDQTLPGTNVTGKEKLAAELAAAMVAFNDRLKCFDWSNRSQATSTEVALRVYDFAREHNMLDMMRQHGLTPELEHRLEVGRACAKIVNDAMDAEADLLSENLGRTQLTPEQRKACIDKMALHMTLRADAATTQINLTVGSKMPERLPGESVESHQQRVKEWSDALVKVAEAGGTGHVYDELFDDLAQGGQKLQQLSRYMLSDPDRAAMAASAENLGFSSLLSSNRNTAAAWANEVREVKKLASFVNDKLNPLRGNPEAKNFVVAAQQIISTGRPEAKRALARMDDRQIEKVCIAMQKNPMMNLGRILENSQNFALPQPKAASRNQGTVT